MFGENLIELRKFHNMSQEYKTKAIGDFLHEMKDYINGILQKYYDFDGRKFLNFPTITYIYNTNNKKY